MTSGSSIDGQWLVIYNMGMKKCKILYMFAKYIDLVGNYEGVTFLYERDWTEEEWELLQRLDRGDLSYLVPDEPV